MYCKYCGKKIDDDSTFCSGCGAKLSIAVKPETAAAKPKIEVKADAPAVMPPQDENAKTAKVKVKKERMLEYDSFDPSPKGILGQFSPLGRVVFIVLCALVSVWVATITFYIFFPQYANILSTI